MSRGMRTAIAAWLITAVYYFYQYTLRSAPAVMMPQLSDAFGLGTLGVASLVGLFYYGYSPFSLVAGVAMDRLGPRMVVPLGAAAVGVGALLFATGNSQMASAGRLLQGAGGVFALIGAVYIATTNFPPSRAATLIGVDPDVRHGRRLRRTIRRRSADRVRRLLAGVLGRDGRRRPRHRRCSLDAPAQRGSRRAARRLDEGRHARPDRRVSQSAIDSLRDDRRAAVHSDHHLRHDLGRPLPAGSTRARLRQRGDQVVDGAGRVDHRLPGARPALGPDRPPQAGDRRERAGALRVPGVHPLRRPRDVSAVRPRPRRRDSSRAPRCCPTR